MARWARTLPPGAETEMSTAGAEGEGPARPGAAPTDTCPVLALTADEQLNPPAGALADTLPCGPLMDDELVPPMARGAMAPGTPAIAAFALP